MNKVLEDKHGNRSSKRVAGFVCIVVGLGLAIASLFVAKQVEPILWPIFVTGGALLGVSVLEK